MKRTAWLGAATAALFLAMPANAASIVYAAALDGTSESPPNASAGFGSAKVTVDFDLVTMRVEASFSGLTGATSAAHIHCCTTSPNTGTAGVATQTPTFAGFPSGVTSGIYDQTFDMTQTSSYGTAFLTAHGGTASAAFNTLVAGLNGGRTYFNIHTTLYGGGEIRGFLAPVPAPAAVWLLGTALASLGWQRASRSRRG